MFGLGFTEILILGLIAFLVFGPQQFPIVARNFIKIFNELRQAFTDVKTEFYDVETEVQKQIHQITDSVSKERGFVKGTQKEIDSFLNKNSNQKDKMPHLENSSIKENSENKNKIPDKKEEV